MFKNKECFYGINKEVDVDMMHNTDEYYLYQGEDISK